MLVDNSMFTPLTVPELLALAVDGEARGETIYGQIAVACVVRNRVATKFRGDDTYPKVILHPKQFSCFNEGDARDRLVKLAIGRGIEPSPDDRVLTQCLWVARGVFDNYIMDVTQGANHYLTRALFESTGRPEWADPKKLVMTIQRHVFLKL